MVSGVQLFDLQRTWATRDFSDFNEHGSKLPTPEKTGKHHSCDPGIIVAMKGRNHSFQRGRVLNLAKDMQSSDIYKVGVLLPCRP